MASQQLWNPNPPFVVSTIDPFTGMPSSHKQSVPPSGSVTLPNGDATQMQPLMVQISRQVSREISPSPNQRELETLADAHSKQETNRFLGIRMPRGSSKPRKADERPSHFYERLTASGNDSSDNPSTSARHDERDPSTRSASLISRVCFISYHV